MGKPRNSRPKGPAIGARTGKITRDPRLTGTRADSWQNPFTGLGSTRDKVTGGYYWPPVRLQDQELLAIFNGSDIGARVVETRPREMFRRGYDLEVASMDVDEDTPEGDVAEHKKYGSKLAMDHKVQESMVWGNLFGGALLIIGAQDGNEMDTPLNEENISTVRYLTMVDRRFASGPHKYYTDPLAPKCGEVEQYMVTNALGAPYGSMGSTLVIHESRVLRFDGARTDVLTKLQLAGWSWSLLQRAYDQLRAFESGFQAVANLMSDASQGVMKIKDLISMIASGNKDDLQTRMAMVDMSRSVARMLLIDADGEEFDRVATSFAGLPDLLDRFMMRLSAAVDIPVAILMGRSAAGMNATGDADFRAFYDSVASDQERHLAPKLERLYHIFARAKDSPFKGRDVEFRMKFHQLWQANDTEQADIELKTAQKDSAYVTAGVFTPEEVALSRAGQGKWISSGMQAFKPEDAKKRQSDDTMMQHMLEPPEELKSKQRGAEPPGSDVPPAPEARGGQGPLYGTTNKPQVAMRQLHTPPKPTRADDEREDAITHRTLRYGKPWSKHHSLAGAIKEANTLGSDTRSMRAMARGEISPRVMTIEAKNASGEWEEVKHPRDEAGRFA